MSASWKLLTGDVGLDHGVCRLTQQITDFHTETNTAIGQQFVQAILPHEYIQLPLLA
ncbi:MAG: hypothetical protein Q7J20_08465 [Candidatus Nitrotoga sp.]|nr:hypothetical protein [Candidatus Nitrotoga sp.]MDO9447906.1 hypothetical protein [Candidatus Nitrotoga sp.]MDP1636870.1 hypothetical protein [Candidatus Nitrotoga sp.]MDP3498202.1 hypothetical protein [Candidatus Nitrotoga sp.]